MKGLEVIGRILVITRALPVESGGTMIVIRRLLENFGRDEIVVLGRTPYKPRVLKNDTPPEYPYFEIPTPQVKGFRLWRMLSVIPGFFQGLWIIWRYRVKVIIGVYPDEGSLLLSAFLHACTRTRYMAYFCDLYMENQKGKPLRFLAKWLQPYVFRHADRILAANAGMKEFYDERYKVESLLMPTAINGSIPESFVLPDITDRFIIGYSGSIVPDRLDPMQALIKTIGNDSRYEIRLFTPQTEEYLRSVKIWGPNVMHRFCASHAELIQELSQCHVLYLPLTFNVEHNSREQLATCFGIKCYEYFQSCRPVIVHCPLDYFTSTFFTSLQCGEAIGSLDNVEIKLTLEKLRSQYNAEGRKYVTKALVAASDFQGSKIAERLSVAVNEVLAVAL